MNLWCCRVVSNWIISVEEDLVVQIKTILTPIVKGSVGEQLKVAETGMDIGYDL